MNFDLGYLVIIGVVVVILLVFRQLDKNNRSLEKIRKYSETVRADLNSFVEERTASIKDFETELKVHDKTAAEILRRIQGLEDGLLQRLPEIESLQSRLDQYGNALKDLESLSGRVDQNLTRLQEESEFVDKVGRRVKIAGEQIETLDNSLAKIRNDFTEANQKNLTEVKQQAVDVFEKQTMLYAQQLESAQTKVDELKEFVGSLNNKQAAYLAETQQQLDEQFQSYMKAAAQKSESLGLDVLQKMDERISGLAKVAEDKLRGELAGLNTRLHGEVTDMDKVLEAVKAESSELRTETEDEINNLKSMFDNSKTEVGAQLMAVAAQLKSDMDTKVAQIRKEILSETETLQNEMKQTLDTDRQSALDLVVGVNSSLIMAQKDIKDQENKLVSTFEERLKEYEASFGYRIQKLEEIGTGVDNLDQNLRAAMEKTTQRIQGDFQTFDYDMKKRREEEQATLENRFQSTRTAMDELEKSLEDLKTRAYESTDAKLKVFEEGFFQDLQKRSIQIQKSFDEWQTNLNTKLEDLHAKTERERAEIERTFTDQTRTKVQELQALGLAQYDKVDKQLLESQEKLANQVQSYHEDTEKARLALKEELIALTEDSKARFKDEFDRHDGLMKENLARLEKELEVKLKALSTNTDMNKAEIQASVEAMRSEATIWQTKFDQKYKELEADLDEQYKNLRQGANDRINAIFSDFTAQKDDLILKTSDERNTLKTELSDLTNQVKTLSESMDTRAAEAMEVFRKDYDNFSQEAQKNNKEISSDMELKIRDYRAMVQDTKDKSEALQKKVFGRIEDQAALLNSTLEEIDKRQKSFLAQTKLFERSDVLKAELTESIEELKAELAKLDSQKRDVAEIENQILRIKKMSDDSNDKLSRFISEKKRIDMIEADFQKIVGLSQAMELRLEQVTSSADLLQEIQLKIRKLEDYAKDMDVRYERIEKRRDILEATTDGVDRNFSILEKMEKTAKLLSEEITHMPLEVEELRKRMKILTQGKDEVERAVQKVNQLDKITTDIDSKISKMEEAREWLARTETRLQEAGQAADEQLKTLAVLSKNTTGTSTKRGSIDADIRQTVIKLAKQGWGKEEIARATKLSQGEVELILELGVR